MNSQSSRQKNWFLDILLDLLLEGVLAWKMSKQNKLNMSYLHNNPDNSRIPKNMPMGYT